MQREGSLSLPSCSTRADYWFQTHSPQRNHSHRRTPSAQVPSFRTPSIAFHYRYLSSILIPLYHCHALKAYLGHPLCHSTVVSLRCFSVDRDRGEFEASDWTYATKTRWTRARPLVLSPLASTRPRCLACLHMATAGLTTSATASATPTLLTPRPSPTAPRARRFRTTRVCSARSTSLRARTQPYTSRRRGRSRA
jgi:hypothetical protein